ncbi:pre-mRNA-processing factor 6-like protein [Striga asiatica]|uniref:Pre-mRNA-processing factor 6-like protein n=1 Tax=Striga asiatica TaxID=4170 RepID=A0A5A7R4A9_STRAF|nr:pre-mRNA-processing factor 6-like protein [Striga asiatica]
MVIGNPDIKTIIAGSIPRRRSQWRYATVVLNAKSPLNYVARLGRGATGFTTCSDIGPACLNFECIGLGFAVWWVMGRIWDEILLTDWTWVVTRYGEIIFLPNTSGAIFGKFCKYKALSWLNC